jgi:hypothetical protein
MPLLGCSIAGSLASVLAIFGLRKDQREFLVPFIFIMSIDIIIGVIYTCSLVVAGETKFEPLTGIIFTIDFFLQCLNVSGAVVKLVVEKPFLIYINCLRRYIVLCASFHNTKSTKIVMYHPRTII